MAKNVFAELVNIVEVLRAPSGCPWDRKQKLSDLKNYILEEAYELCDALDEKNYHLVKEELGDLFLLLVFFSSLCREQKLFTVDDAIEGIIKKLIVRHPHVFSTRKLKTAKAVLYKWIKSKSKKKKRTSLYQRIPKNAPALFSLYLFLKEYTHIGKVNSKTIKKNFSKSLARAKTTDDKNNLVDLIFYAACILTLRRKNPELLLKRKVKKESSRIFYETPKVRKKK